MLTTSALPRILATAALAIGLTLGGSNADARSFRQAQLPNAPFACNTCHTMGGGTARNSFGLDVGRTLDGTNVDWAAVCPLDSDNDGASNGLELNDPDCTWRIGDPQRGQPTFNPANPNSTPPPPDAGMPDTGVVPDTGTPDAGSEMDAAATPDAGSVDAVIPVDSGTAADAGTTPSPDTGTGGGEDDDGGCTCAAPPGGPGAWLALLPLAGLALMCSRRRR